MDSDDYSTDELSKKRRLEDRGLEESFGKSRRTERSPAKAYKKNEDKLDMLLNMMQDLKIEIQQIRKDQTEYVEEIRKLKTENINLRKENKEIKEELTEIRNNVEWFEKERRKNNVVMNGVKIETRDPTLLKEIVKNLIVKYLEVDVQIETAYKLGEKSCLIKLGNEQDKMKIMRNKYKLKEVREEKIYINSDLTEKEREIQKQVNKKAKEERINGKVVKIGYNKVTINGIQWKWNKEKGKLEITEPKN